VLHLARRAFAWLSEVCLHKTFFISQSPLKVVTCFCCIALFYDFGFVSLFFLVLCETVATFSAFALFDAVLLVNLLFLPYCGLQSLFVHQVFPVLRFFIRPTLHLVFCIWSFCWLIAELFCPFWRAEGPLRTLSQEAPFFCTLC
jgi:hypothetical protein